TANRVQLPRAPRPSNSPRHSPPPPDLVPPAVAARTSRSSPCSCSCPPQQPAPAVPAASAAPTAWNLPRPPTLPRPLWHGTLVESAELLRAVARNCTCTPVKTPERLAVCASHQMLGEDQRALDGLLFARFLSKRLKREEFVTA